MMVATVPNLKAIKLPRPQEAVPGWHGLPLLHHLRLQCTCISGWPWLNSPQEQGRGRMRLGIHTMPKRWVPARVCHRETCLLLCVHHPRPNPYQRSEQKLSLFLGAWSLTLKGDFLLHLSLLPQNRVSFPIGADSVMLFLVTLQWLPCPLGYLPLPANHTSFMIIFAANLVLRQGLTW